MGNRVDCYLVVDFETGGFNAKHSPITEVGIRVINPTTFVEVERYESFIRSEPKLVGQDFKPESDPINVYEDGYYFEGALKITGISINQLRKEGKNYIQVEKDIEALIKRAHIGDRYAKPIFVGQNFAFDVLFIQMLFFLAKIDLSKLVTGYHDLHGNFVPFFIDTMHDTKRAFPNNEKFNLQALCTAMKVDYIDGHRAMNDVIPTSEIFEKLSINMRNQGTEIVEKVQKEKRRKHFQF